MELSEYRKLFPVTTQKIYLNHAAISPMSLRVTEMLEWYMDERCFGIIDIYPRVLEIREAARAMAANLLNTDPAHIAFITNTSEGFNILAQGLSWKSGDQILLTDYEFPSNIYPFKNLERHGVELILIPNRNGRIEIEDIQERITPRTRLLSISFVEFSNGFCNDLRAIGQICRDHEIIFSVDSIQGLGAMELDVQACSIDFLSNGGHKWLMGPMGAGILYIHPRLLERITPCFTGWLAVEDAWNFFDYRLDFLPDARRFEYATSNFMGICGLKAAMELLLEIGIGRIEKHLLNLGERMVKGLSDMGLQFLGAADKKYWSGIYSFAGPEMETLFSHLKEQDIIGSLRNGNLRISPHFYNTTAEIDDLIASIRKFYHP